MKIDAELLVRDHLFLGESPCWDHRTGILYWVDILEGTLHRYDLAADAHRTFTFASSLGSAVPAAGSGLVLALQHGLFTFEPGTGMLCALTDPAPCAEGLRYNDCRVDPAGRLWLGVMAVTDDIRGTGSLRCLTNGHGSRTVLRNLSIPNGMAWNAAADTMYYIDSIEKCVWAFDYGRTSGSISNRRTVVTVPDERGLPDGMSIDTDGNLWVAHFGGSAVYCYDAATGATLHEIRLPTENVTACTFGGPDMRTLFITTAREDLDETALAAQPLAGSVFRAELPVAGPPAFEYKNSTVIDTSHSITGETDHEAVTIR